MDAISKWLCPLFLASALLLAQAAVAADNFTRQDVTFTSVGKKLVGWLYVPNGMKQGEKRPTIVMAHGWSAVKEMYLDDFAARFSNGGFVVLVFDYRNFGDSEGEPRGHIDPHMQHEDYKNAITWASLQPIVDGGHIGIWGSSYSGGHVMHLAAFDRRVKCAVAQVPLVNAVNNFRRLVRADHWSGLVGWLAADRAEEYTTGKVNYFDAYVSGFQGASTPALNWFKQHLMK